MVVQAKPQMQHPCDLCNRRRPPGVKATEEKKKKKKKKSVCSQLQAHWQVLSLGSMSRQAKGSPHRQENWASFELELLLLHWQGPRPKSQAGMLVTAAPCSGDLEMPGPRFPPL